MGSGIIKGSVSVNSLSLWPLLITLSLINLDITIHEKTVETLSSNGVALRTKQSTSTPSRLCSIQSWGLVLSPTGGSKSSTTLHRGGGEGKALFTLFEGQKTTERAFRTKSVSTNFLALIAV